MSTRRCRGRHPAGRFRSAGDAASGATGEVPAMSVPCVVKVGRTTAGYRLRVEGTGTMRESPAVSEFAGHALGDGASTLVVDLTACDYLDSTFLGCLVNLQLHHGRGEPPRLLIAASPGVGRRSFAANHLEPLFR